MTPFRLVSDPRADLDIEPAFRWYESEKSGLGLNFLEELRAAYDRTAKGPLKYQVLRSSVRHALLRRFPYAVYFSVEENTVVILAVLHVGRDPAVWQSRIGYQDW